MESDISKPKPQAYIQGRQISREDEGRCFSCGFLRGPVNTMESSEIPWRVRCDPSITTSISNCLIWACDLPAEIEQEVARTGGTHQQAMAIVYKRDRKCAYWQAYSPGK